MLTKEMVKNSIEARWHKGQIIMFGIISLCFPIVAFLITLFSGLLSEDSLLALEVVGVVLLVCLLIVGPLTLYNIYKYFFLFRYLAQYEIYEVVLDKPNVFLWINELIYYTVLFRTSQNKLIKRNTKPFWSTAIFAPFHFEDYINKTIKIAYNADTDTMIILGL